MNRVTLDSRRGVSILVAVVVVLAAGALLAGSAAAAAGDDVDAAVTSAEEAPDGNEDICAGECQWAPDVDDHVPDVEPIEPPAVPTTSDRSGGQATPNDICQGGPPCPGYYIEQWLERLPDV